MTTSCAMCSTSEQKARARRVDVGPTRDSWSLQCEHVTPMSVTSLDTPLLLLHARHPLVIYCVAPNRQTLWFALIMASRYPSYSPSNPLCQRSTFGGSNCVGLAGKRDSGSRLCHRQFWRSIRNLYVRLDGFRLDINATVRILQAMLESEASGAKILWQGPDFRTVFWIARLQQLDPNALDGRMTTYGLCMLLSYHTVSMGISRCWSIACLMLAAQPSSV